MSHIRPLLILDSHGWDDFPHHLHGTDADQLLTAWTTLWHPQFLLAAQKVPLWCRPDEVHAEISRRHTAAESVEHRNAADEGTVGQEGASRTTGLTDPLGPCVILRPSFLRDHENTPLEFPEGSAPTEQDDHHSLAAAPVTIDGPFPARPDLLAQIFQLGQATDAPGTERVRDSGSSFLSHADAVPFFALGYGYLQAQLLTCQMGYSSYLDQDFFLKRLLQAAEAAVAGKRSQSIELLRSCFDTLAQQRDHYYPVDAYILDVTVVDEATSGNDLQRQLSWRAEDGVASSQSGHVESAPPAHSPDQADDDLAATNDPSTTNLLMLGRTVDYLAKHHPDSLGVIQEGLRAGWLGLVGGLQSRLEIPMVAAELTRDDIQSGWRTFETHLGRRPSVFGMQRFGLHPDLPQLLLNLGYDGALQFTLDDGQFPVADQVKTAWSGPGGAQEGGEGTSIDAVSCVPLDSSLPETYLRLAVHMGLSIEKDHVATVCLVHRPNAASVWHQDVALATRLGLSLGRFSTFDRFLQETSSVVGKQRFTADDYLAPYLEQDVASQVVDPISRHAKRAISVAVEKAMNWVATSTKLVTNHDELSATDRSIPQHFASALASSRSLSSTNDDAGPGPVGTLLINPHCVPIRCHIQGLANPPANRDALGDATLNLIEKIDDGSCGAIVTVPACGYVWLECSHRMGVPCNSPRDPADDHSPHAISIPHDSAPLLDGLTMRNEFLQVEIDPQTGGVRSIRGYRDRGNRLSQQIAVRGEWLRDKSPGDGSDRNGYSRMVADTVTPGPVSNLAAELSSTGRCLDQDGNVLAHFVQRVRLARGQRVVEMDIRLELEPATEKSLVGRPWHHYVACRWAWPKSGWSLYADVADVTYPRDAKRAFCNSFLDIRSAEKQTALLTGGLPYFYRSDQNQADTILVVEGESARQFRFAVALDTQRPEHDAAQFMAPPLVVDSAPRPSADTGWLFHFSSRRVRATDWDVLHGESQSAEGKIVGFRFRVRETRGQATRFLLTAFRPVSLSYKTDFIGNHRQPLPIVDGQIEIELGPHEWTEVEAYW